MNDIILIDLLEEMLKEKYPWEKYYVSNDTLPLEDYSHNMINNIIECPILLEETSIDNCTLLTCCKQFISDESFHQLKNKVCPLCRQDILINYVSVIILTYQEYGDRHIIGIDLNDRINDLEMKIRKELKIVRSVKLFRGGRHLIRLYPLDKSLKYFNVNSGSLIIVRFIKRNIILIYENTHKLIFFNCNHISTLYF